MNEIISVKGKAFHLAGHDVDTDRIIPARFINCVEPEHFRALGTHVFEDDRKQLCGEHPFDKPENKGCEILVVGANFGCGSSREHAVTALQHWGIKAIIAKSFAAIFRDNATANGLVCVDIREEHHKDLVEQLLVRGKVEIAIDLAKMILIASDEGGSFDYPIAIPSADRDMLITGTWDTTATLLLAGDKIEDIAARLPYLQTA